MKITKMNINSELTINRADDNDLPEIARLYEMFWGDVTDLNRMKSKFDKCNNDKNYHLLVAKIDEKIVGTIYAVICDELYGECKPFLVMEDLIVSKEYRRRGIAKALLSSIEEIGRNNECSQIQFITEADRIDAVSFYEKMGYNSKMNIGFKKKINA